MTIFVTQMVWPFLYKSYAHYGLKFPAHLEPMNFVLFGSFSHAYESWRVVGAQETLLDS